MSIQAFLKRKCKDTAVFWGFTKTAQDGVPKYSEPIEIKCMWRDRFQNVIDPNGREVISKATVYVLEDLNPQGMLYKGSLASLTNKQKLDPRAVKTAYEIKLFLKTPGPEKENDFNRRILL